MTFGCGEGLVRDQPRYGPALPIVSRSVTVTTEAVAASNFRYNECATFYMHYEVKLKVNIFVIYFLIFKKIYKSAFRPTYIDIP